MDDAVKAGLGPRWAAIGPFETLDLAGLDVHLQVAQRLFPSLAANEEPPAKLRRLVEEGALGCKTGRGLYGEYGADTVATLSRRRANVLLTLASLGGDDPEPQA